MAVISMANPSKRLPPLVQTEMGYQSLEKGTSLLCLDRDFIDRDFIDRDFIDRMKSLTYFVIKERSVPAASRSVLCDAATRVLYTSVEDRTLEAREECFLRRSVASILCKSGWYMIIVCQYTRD
jgi:hypothetical protein